MNSLLPASFFALEFYTFIIGNSYFSVFFLFHDIETYKFELEKRVWIDQLGVINFLTESA